jgi:cytochrome c biogenesis protein CcmG/thiol:disulfide interchange protein DsbE
MTLTLRIAVAAALAVWLGQPVVGKSVGEAAPDFSRTDMSGHLVRLADYRGKLLLLNFWASWCAPCLNEMPKFSDWQRTYGARGFQVIGVSMDDDAAPVERLLVRKPAGYPILMGDAKFGELFGGVMGLPLTYLIDTQGRIAGRYQGESDLSKMEARIRTLLPRPPP